MVEQTKRGAGAGGEYSWWEGRRCVEMRDTGEFVEGVQTVRDDVQGGKMEPCFAWHFRHRKDEYAQVSLVVPAAACLPG